MSHTLHPSFRLFALALFCISTGSFAIAAGSSTAEGILTIEQTGKPLSVKLTHVYYSVGPDRFDASKQIRSIAFTPSDQLATIEACADLRCASLASVDGFRIELTEEGMVNWWAHIPPMQYASSDSSALNLDVDTSERVAGTFKLKADKVTVIVNFDVTLTKAFAQSK